MIDEAIEEAYREGFEAGEAQMSAYERGYSHASVNKCWERSDAKAELDKTDEQRSMEHLEEAFRTVSTWAKWKRNVLGDNTSDETRAPCTLGARGQVGCVVWLRSRLTERLPDGA